MDKAGQTESAVPGATHTGTSMSQPGQKRGSGGIALTFLEVEVIGCFC